MTIRKQLILSFIGVLLVPSIALIAVHWWHIVEARKMRDAEFIRASRDAFHEVASQEREVHTWAMTMARDVARTKQVPPVFDYLKKAGLSSWRADVIVISDASNEESLLAETAAISSLVLVWPNRLLTAGVSDEESSYLMEHAADLRTQVKWVLDRRLVAPGPLTSFGLTTTEFGGWNIAPAKDFFAMYRINYDNAFRPVKFYVGTGTATAKWVDPTLGSYPLLSGHGGELLKAEGAHMMVSASYDQPADFLRPHKDPKGLPSNLELISVVDDDVLYGGLDLLDTRLAGGVAFAAGLTLLLAWYLSRGYKRSVDAIAQGIRAIGKGEWMQVERQSKNELGEQLVDTLNQAMQEASRRTQGKEAEVWSQLVCNLAHEVNNTLAPIKSMAQTLGSELIVDRADALADFVARCSEIARVPSPSLVRFDLAALAASAAQSFAALAAERNVRITLHIASSQVMLDPVQIERVLMNLMKNAAEAATHEVQVRVTEGRVEITDDGPGVAPEAKAKLFTPFFTTKPNGTGLGLALARHLVLAHGGSLQLTDNASGGSIARLELPTMQSAHAA